MSNERTAVMTEPQPGMVAAHQPGQDVFKSVLPDDIDWKPFAAFPPSVRLAVIVGQPSEVAPYTIRVRVPHGVKLMPHRHPEDRVYSYFAFSTSVWAISSTLPHCKRTRPEASSFCPAIRPISTGRNPVSTSRRWRRLDRLDSNTSARKTIQETIILRRHLRDFHDAG
jgi:hypothetical protein